MAWPDSVDMEFDHRVWNDTEAVTYLSKPGEAPPLTGTQVEGTLWMSIRKDRLTGDSLLAKIDLSVSLAVARLKGIVPKADDIMVRTNGTRWVIKLVEWIVVEDEYRVHVIQDRTGT